MVKKHVWHFWPVYLANSGSCQNILYIFLKSDLKAIYSWRAWQIVAIRNKNFEKIPRLGEVGLILPKIWTKFQIPEVLGLGAISPKPKPQN